MADRRYTIEELQAQAAAVRAADTGLCDSFTPVVVTEEQALMLARLPLPPHGPLCGCNSLVGFIEGPRAWLCANCGRHMEPHDRG